MTIISPVFVYLFGSPELLEKYSLAEIIGLRTSGISCVKGPQTSLNYILSGLLSASLVPLLLTLVLFLGPTAMLLLDVRLTTLLTPPNCVV